MGHLFEDGKEYVSYNSLEELEEKINFLKKTTPAKPKILPKMDLRKP